MTCRVPRSNHVSIALLTTALASGCGRSTQALERCPYSSDQLETWFSAGKAVLGVPGTTLFDNDEGVGCLVIGVTDMTVKPAVEDKLRALGIPLNAVRVIVAAAPPPA